MGLQNTTIGPLLVGVFSNTFLYGLVTYQFAAYYKTKYNDRPMIKYMVLLLFILNMFYSASVIYMAWYYTVLNFDNPEALATAIWPHQFGPINTAINALVTQIYLGFRIWRLTKSKILYGLVIIIAIPSCVLGVSTGISAYIIKVEVLSEYSRMTTLVTAWLSLQVILDTFITFTLIIVLCRSRTGFHTTDTIINRLIRGAIQTGLFTVIFSLTCLILFVLFPNMGFYMTFAIPLGNIYTNTLMDTLLTRRPLMAAMDGGSCPLTSHIVITEVITDLA